MIKKWKFDLKEIKCEFLREPLGFKSPTQDISIEAMKAKGTADVKEKVYY